ncbi:6418_t:CDS:10, partial [Scutellospora calospora]
AYAKMLSTNWIQHANDNLLELLERLDVVGSNIAQEVLVSIFSARLDIVQILNFDELFWENLTTEGSFLDESKLGEILSEVTRLAFYIQKYNDFMNQVTDEDQVNFAFIVGQLFLMAKLLDYRDEVERRKMCSLLREILMSSNILESHIESIMEIEKKISINERDFTRSKIEIITDIREGIEDDEAPSRLTYQRRISNASMIVDDSKIFQEEDNEMNTILANLRCLHIIRCMLEKNSESLRDNPSMYDLMNEIIIPNIQSHEPVLRELDIHCLGLCCILDQGNEILELLRECFMNENEQVQATAVVGISKLMLSKMLRDKHVLKELVLLYFDINTASNLRLRQ